MRKKKMVLGLAACLLVLGVSFGTTYAYLIAEDSAVNTFTVGENTVEIVEEYEPPEKLEPGITFKKTPYVQNTGNLDCFVRIRVDFSDSRAQEFSELLEMDTANWEYDSADGYYYYKKLLKPQEQTTALFTGVSVKDTYDTADMIDFDILIYTESCQHTDHDGACAQDEYKTVWNK